MKSQKELKEEYKTRKARIGVFQIKNTNNGKVYIDGSMDLNAIWNRSKMELNFGTYRNEQLQNEWKQFGEENFQYEILREIEQKEGSGLNYAHEVKLLAKMYIDEWQPFAEKGYNKI